VFAKNMTLGNLKQQLPSGEGIGKPMSQQAEKKPSEVLREALALMDGGKRWIKGRFYKGDSCCSIGAIRKVVKATKEWDWMNKPEYLPTRAYLISAVGQECADEWNDSAADFSVIEQGFNAAIALAESEGR
jgi:hypothetical protein